jgi:hypothetical protein
MYWGWGRAENNYRSGYPVRVRMLTATLNFSLISKKNAFRKETQT